MTGLLMERILLMMREGRKNVGLALVLFGGLALIAWGGMARGSSDVSHQTGIGLLEPVSRMPVPEPAG